MTAAQHGLLLVYIGTYTRAEPHVHGRAAGIYLYQLDPATGALTHRSTFGGVVNPSFLAIHPSGRLLYAVNEVPVFAGRPGGAVSAFAIDPRSGVLTALNQQPTHGAGPCHLSTDRTGRWLLVANYGGGSVTVLPIEADGQLGAPTAVVQHQGHSIDPERQQAPHAHSVVVDPTNRFALVADLGLDKIMMYRLDETRGTLQPHDPPWAPVHAGAGPRHLAFDPRGQHLYCINELDSTLTVFAYDAQRGALQEIQTLATLPPGAEHRNFCADVHVAPSGKFVYGSNRGHDSIAIFAIDEGNGTLSAVGHAATQGRTPRNFGIDPTGRLLLAANQDSDTIVSFRINAESGSLTPTGHVAAVPSPVCVRMLAPMPDLV